MIIQIVIKYIRMPLEAIIGLLVAFYSKWIDSTTFVLKWLEMAYLDLESI